MTEKKIHINLFNHELIEDIMQEEKTAAGLVCAAGYSVLFLQVKNGNGDVCLGKCKVTH